MPPFLRRGGAGRASHPGNKEISREKWSVNIHASLDVPFRAPKNFLHVAHSRLGGGGVIQISRNSLGARANYDELGRVSNPRSKKACLVKKGANLFQG